MSQNRLGEDHSILKGPQTKEHQSHDRQYNDLVELANVANVDNLFIVISKNLQEKH